MRAIELQLALNGKNCGSATRLLLAAAACAASAALPMPIVSLLLNRPRECLLLFRDSLLDAVSIG